MKKAIFLRFVVLCLVFLGSEAKAQMYFIPDTNFRAYLQAWFAGCMNATGDSLDGSCPAVLNSINMNVSNRNIFSLDGIQAFQNLQTLNCEQNQLTSLPALPSSLSTLACRFNQLTNLPSLPSSLSTLDCEYNQLTSLPALPSSLNTLVCAENQLTSLPALPSFLTDLRCHYNQLTSIPTLPSSLIFLSCGSNQLTSLPSLPSALDTLFCPFNLLTNLPALPSALRYLFCADNGLTSLPALSSSLTFLRCDNNQLTSLPALPTSLTRLDCRANQLNNLPAIPLSLTTLYCTNNLLTSLPALPSSLIFLASGSNQLTSLPALPSSLINLYCDYNQLTSLPALPSTLTVLGCSENQLTSLPALPSSLINLNCSNNQLTSLPALPSTLTVLGCSENQLTSLPALPSTLTVLGCSNNQLTSLPALPSSLTTLDCYYNINLNCLPDLNNIQILNISFTGIQCLPNYGQIINCTPSLSSFPICDLYNANACEVAWNISGNVYFDNDSNCVKDIADSGISNQKIELYQNGSLVQQTYSNNDGNYYFDTDSLAIYSTSIDTSGLQFSILCPINAVYIDTLTTIDSLKSNRDFAAKCKGIDLAVSSIYGTVFRPASQRPLIIHAGDFSNNFGGRCAAGVSGSVQIIVSGPCQYVSATSGALLPTTINGDTLVYSVSDFGSIDFNTVFGIEVLVDTFATMGSQICVNVQISTIANEIDTTNNNLTQCFNIVNSFDPNDKSVYPTQIQPGVNNWLTYNINFQNTGNADAIDIFITDTLDANLDWSTFELLSYSHFPLVQLYNTGVLKFNYPKIYLPDSTTNEPRSHGYVQYKIKAKNNLALSDTIKNTANIYFDFNAPIITNTTKNYATVAGINNIQNVNNFTVYPNPFREELSISRNESSKAILEIYNLLGEQILQREIQDKRTILSTQTWPTGIYIVKMIGEKEVVTQRVVKN